MRSDDILDAIGELDEALVRNAKNIKRSHKTLWMTLGSIAACILITFMFPIVFISMKGANSEAPDSAENANPTDKPHISIYYVEGDIISVDKIEFAAVEDVFNAWRNSNCLGENVQFIDHFFICSSDDPSSSTVVNIWISDEIENYYETVDKDLLLKSLKLTMMEYFDVSEDLLLLNFM